MHEEIEITELDLRYEVCRMRNQACEGKLLVSIRERGIEEALEGVDRDGRRVLLNGFKRHRCALALGISTVPYKSLGESESSGIINLLRPSENNALNILEQAHFLEELQGMHKLSIAELAQELSHSKSWVSMRLSLCSQMSDKVREKLFKGAFPVYSYMYTLRMFMRMNGVRMEEIETFVLAVSGKKLSVREVEQLAHCFFRGPESLRDQIAQGTIGLPLKSMTEVPVDENGCNEFERILLKDLEHCSKYMQQIMGKSKSKRIGRRAFYAQANLLTAGILSRTSAFTQSLKELYDISGQA